MRRHAGRTALPVAAVATAALAVLGTGSITAMSMGSAAGRPAAASNGGADLATAPLEQPAGPGLAAAGDSALPPPAAGGQAPPVAPAAAGAPGVAPLTTLRVPDLVVRGSGPLPADLVQRLRALPGVTASALLDAGTVTFAGADTSLVGVDPSEFRAFTPQETAASDPLWQAVARGDLAIGYAAAQQRKIELASIQQVSGTWQRVGALASFGLAAADLVASRSVAAAVGATPGSALVLAAPGMSTSALSATVTKAVAGAAQVQVLRPAEVAAPQLSGKPRSWRDLYIASARYCPGLRWQVLAAIGQVESGHGRNNGPSSAGALGPMQFMPATWAAYGIDGDGDRSADIMNPFDAVPSAARYLCANGAQDGDKGLYGALFAYNRADWYVQMVLALSAKYS